jgi:hypothetical protein
MRSVRETYEEKQPDRGLIQVQQILPVKESQRNIRIF